MPTPIEIDVKVHQKAFSRAYDGGHETYCNEAEKSENYVFGEQWHTDDKKRMDTQRKPTLTINKILPAVAAIYGEWASMNSELSLQATHDDAADNATVLSKVIKHCLQRCRYEDLKNEQALSALITNRGFVRMTLDDSVDPSGEIKIEPMDSNFVVLSPDVKQYDPDAWPEVFFFDWMDEQELELNFGDEAAASVTDSVTAYNEDTWRWKHTVGEGEQATRTWDTDSDEREYRVVTREFFALRNVWMFTDTATTEFRTIPCDDMSKRKAQQYARENRLQLSKIKHKCIYVVSWVGETVLKEGWSPYRHFTVYPMFCYFHQGKLMSAVKNLMSIQDQLNKAESQELHAVNSLTNGGWTVEENSLVNMTEAELQERGSETGLVIVTRRGYEKPGKIQPNSIPSGLSVIGQKAGVHMQEVSGVNAAMMGQMPPSAAARLAEAKRAAGSTLLQWPIGNMLRAESFLVRGVLDIIQEYFTEERVFLITNGDGETQEVLKVNSTDPEGNPLANLNIGRFDVRLVRKPKQDAVEDYELLELMQMREAGAEIPEWMLLQKSHISNKAELVAAARRKAGLDLSEEEQALQKLTQQLAIEDAKITLEEKRQKALKLQAETAKLQAETQDIAVAQNLRLVAQHEHEKAVTAMGNNLRTDLADRSANNALTKALLASTHSKEIAQLQADTSLTQTAITEANKAELATSKEPSKDKEADK